MTSASPPWRRLLLPAAMTALMLAITCGLGVWQVQRLHWKTALLADIDRAEASPATPLPTDTGALPAFAKMRVEGSFIPGSFAQYGAEGRDTPLGPRIGARQIVALRRADGPPVLVDRGWAPSDRMTTIVIPTGPVAFDAYVRMPDRPNQLFRWFLAKDDPAKRLFYTLDPATIGRTLGLADAAPFMLVALGPPTPGVFPEPATMLPRPPNDHLTYAFTWFGLALALLVIFMLYCRKVLRNDGL